MARIVPDDVRVILDTEVTDEAIAFAIDAAVLKLSDTVEAEATPPSDAELRLIETYLAAHYVAVSDPQADQVQIGDVRVQFESPDDVEGGLGETRFGRAAMNLDPTDALVADESGTSAAIFQTFGHDADDW